MNEYFYFDDQFVKTFKDFIYPIIDILVKISLGVAFAIYLQKRNTNEKIKDKLIDIYVKIIKIQVQLGSIRRKQIEIDTLEFIYQNSFWQEGHNHYDDFRNFSSFEKQILQHSKLFNEFVILDEQVRMYLTETKYKSKIEAKSILYMNSISVYNEELEKIKEQEFKTFLNTGNALIELHKLSVGLKNGFITKSEFEEEIILMSNRLYDRIYRLFRESSCYSYKNDYLSELKVQIDKL